MRAKHHNAHFCSTKYLTEVFIIILQCTKTALYLLLPRQKTHSHMHMECDLNSQRDGVPLQWGR